MADAFTDMHQQLNGKTDERPDYNVLAARGVRRYAKKTDAPDEVESVLLDILGLV